MFYVCISGYLIGFGIGLPNGYVIGYLNGFINGYVNGSRTIFVVTFSLCPFSFLGILTV